MLGQFGVVAGFVAIMITLIKKWLKSYSQNNF